MKFRIQEQRGKFRIEAFVNTGQQFQSGETIEVESRWFRPDKLVIEKRHQEAYEWHRVYVTDGRPRMVISRSELTASFTPTQGVNIHANPDCPTNHEAIFDSYEEAEDFIFQQYGWEGWRSIEKPEWKTV